MFTLIPHMITLKSKAFGLVFIYFVELISANLGFLVAHLLLGAFLFLGLIIISILNLI